MKLEFSPLHIADDQISARSMTNRACTIYVHKEPYLQFTGKEASNNHLYHGEYIPEYSGRDILDCTLDAL